MKHTLLFLLLFAVASRADSLDAKQTDTFRRIKSHLDRVPAIDTHDHLKPFATWHAAEVFLYLLRLNQLAATPDTISAPANPQKVGPTGTVSPAARPLIQKAIQAAGGKTNLLGFFAFKDHVRVGEKETGSGAKRESVMDAPRHWWLKSAGGYSEREDEPATFLVWAWTLGALTSAASTIEIVPAMRDGDMELWGLRVSGSVEPAMALYFSKTNDLLARIDWRSDIHRFSAWTALPTGTKYPARAVGYKKDTGKTWYYDDVTEVTPLKELPEKLQPTQPFVK